MKKYFELLLSISGYSTSNIELINLKDIKYNLEAYGEKKNNPLKIFGGCSFNIEKKGQDIWNDAPKALFSTTAQLQAGVVTEVLESKGSKSQPLTAEAIASANSGARKRRSYPIITSLLFKPVGAL